MIEKYQRTLTLDDVDAIVELDRIAERIEKNAKQVTERDWFCIEGHYFKKPTFARADLIERIQEKYGDSGVFSVSGILYALDANLSVEDMERVPSRWQLTKYVCKLDIPIRKAVDALNELYSDDGGDGGEESSPWEICSVLSREIGGGPDEWYHASPQKLKSAIKAVEDKHEAEMKAMGGKSGPPRETPKLLAIVEFRNKLKALEESWQVA